MNTHIKLLEQAVEEASKAFFRGEFSPDREWSLTKSLQGDKYIFCIQDDELLVIDVSYNGHGTFTLTYTDGESSPLRDYIHFTVERDWQP